MSKGPLGPVLILLPILWDGANMSGPRETRNKSPTWAGGLWSTSPVDHKQLAVRMVCSWGLVKAYQWTRQNTYVCPLAPHIMEAYNHKVNHDSHKELGPQEHAQSCSMPAHCSTYPSAMTRDTRICLAPAVKAFWNEVVEPFRQ